MTIELKVCWPAGVHPEIAPVKVMITLEVEPAGPKEIRDTIDYWMNATAIFYPGARVEYRTGEQDSNMLRQLPTFEFEPKRDRQERAQEKRAHKKVIKIRPDPFR